MTLNYIEHFLTLVFISAFGSLVDISKGIKSPTTELNICAIIGRIKTYKSITLSGNIWVVKYRKKYGHTGFWQSQKLPKTIAAGVGGFREMPCPALLFFV